ncbi:F-box/LRR-repeat protein 7-like isoform X3 [Odontomachus brunneus]|uniref:F-box/LRR-repeat protein 7-like isoform X3 n=1 Tax=Odontomachus brunneus TaxID=486640 RepID=UPI0013F1CD1F|nr:F-box/LRR-repeat protein 7-like isoform X3 [Odontomachus brunneus]
MEETQKYDFQDAFINILDDDCLIHIFQFLPIVDKIRIERVCKRWRILSLDSWYTMKKIDTSFLLEGFPTHHRITEFILKKVMKTLSRNGRFITELHLSCPATMFPSDVAQFNRKLFDIVMKYCSNLTNINVSMITINKKDKQLLGRYKNITRLTLGTFYNLDKQETFFQEYPQLNYLQILSNFDFVGKCLPYLPAQTMRTLILCDCPRINEITFSMKLKMKNFPFSPQHFVEITMNCQQITSLDISGSSCDDISLKIIATLPKLEYLNISYVCGITDYGLKNLKNLKGLRCKKCRNITDNGIYEILNFSPQLQLLDLTYCSRITNNIYEVAKVIHDDKPGKMVLKIYNFGTQIFLTDKHKVHPTVQLINIVEQLQQYTRQRMRQRISKRNVDLICTRENR